MQKNFVITNDISYCCAILPTDRLADCSLDPIFPVIFSFMKFQLVFVCEYLDYQQISQFRITVKVTFTTVRSFNIIKPIV